MYPKLLKDHQCYLPSSVIVVCFSSVNHFIWYVYANLDYSSPEPGNIPHPANKLIQRKQLILIIFKEKVEKEEKRKKKKTFHSLLLKVERVFI